MNDPLSTDCDVRARARAWIKNFDAFDGRKRFEKKKELAIAITDEKTEKRASGLGYEIVDFHPVSPPSRHVIEMLAFMEQLRRRLRAQSNLSH